MNDELVERVARAILHRRTQNDLNITINGTYVLDWDKEVARAAIAECEKEPVTYTIKVPEELKVLQDKCAKLEAEAVECQARLRPDADPDDPSVTHLTIHNTVSEWMLVGYRLHAVGAVQQKIERLERRIAELVAALDKHYGTPCEQIRHNEKVADLEAGAAAMRVALITTAECIQLLGARHCVQVDGAAPKSDADAWGIYSALTQAREALFPDAGQKVLDVVRAARDVDFHRQLLLPDKHEDLQEALDKLTIALYDLGWKP